MDLDNDPSVEARRQNVEFGCPCASGFCLNGGTCVDAVPPYCMCLPGWTGPQCGIIVTDPNPGLFLVLRILEAKIQTLKL